MSSLGGLFCLLTALLLAVLDPVGVLARFKMRITETSPLYKLMEKQFEGVQLSAYLFNLTNTDAFLAGTEKKLRVEEIGPFVYQEKRDNLDMEFNTNENSVVYSPYTIVNYNPNGTFVDPKNITLNVFNFPFMGLASNLADRSFWTKAPFNMLTTNLNSKALVQTDAEKYLWGYDDKLMTMIHTVIPGLISTDKLGVLQTMYDPKPYRVEVAAADHEKMLIRKVNGVRGLKYYGYETQRSRCNSFEDTYEGLIYPPKMTPDRPVRIFRNVLCRIFDWDFVGYKSMDYGGRTLRYQMSNSTYDVKESNDCLCAKGPCTKGVTDVSQCLQDMPVLISFPHFTNGDPVLYERLDGLSPHPRKMYTELLIDELTGLSMGMEFSIQVNLLMKDTRFNSQARPYSDMILPIAWFNVKQRGIPAEVSAILYQAYVIAPVGLLVIQIILTIVGTFLVGYVAKYVYWNSCFNKHGIEFKIVGHDCYFHLLE